MKRQYVDVIAAGKVIGTMPAVSDMQTNRGLIKTVIDGVAYVQQAGVKTRPTRSTVRMTVTLEEASKHGWYWWKRMAYDRQDPHTFPGTKTSGMREFVAKKLRIYDEYEARVKRNWQEPDETPAPKKPGPKPSQFRNAPREKPRPAVVPKPVRVKPEKPKRPLGRPPRRPSWAMETPAQPPQAIVPIEEKDLEPGLILKDKSDQIPEWKIEAIYYDGEVCLSRIGADLTLFNDEDVRFHLVDEMPCLYGKVS